MNDYKKEMVETSDEEDIEGDDEVNEILSHTQSKKMTIIAFCTLILMLFHKLAILEGGPFVE